MSITPSEKSIFFGVSPKIKEEIDRICQLERRTLKAVITPLLEQKIKEFKKNETR